MLKFFSTRNESATVVNTKENDNTIIKVDENTDETYTILTQKQYRNVRVHSSIAKRNSSNNKFTSNKQMRNSIGGGLKHV